MLGILLIEAVISAPVFALETAFGLRFSSPKSTVSQDINNKLLTVNNPIIF
jgi:hypothetical protein